MGTHRQRSTSFGHAGLRHGCRARGRAAATSGGGLQDGGRAGQFRREGLAMSHPTRRKQRGGGRDPARHT